MTPAEHIDIAAHRILADAIADGTSIHRAVLQVQVLFAFEAAENFWNCVAHAAMDTPTLRAAAMDAIEFQVAEGVKVLQTWEVTAGQPEFDAQAAYIIRAAFQTRVDDLYINAKLHGTQLGNPTLC